jgi:hypothetical protein
VRITGQPNNGESVFYFEYSQFMNQLELIHDVTSVTGPNGEQLYAKSSSGNYIPLIGLGDFVRSSDYIPYQLNDPNW